MTLRLMALALSFAARTTGRSNGRTGTKAPGDSGSKEFFAQRDPSLTECK